MNIHYLTYLDTPEENIDYINTTRLSKKINSKEGYWCLIGRTPIAWAIGIF